MIKTVVFDFNGTLLADTNACLEADNHVLKTFGGKPISLKVFRGTFSIPAIDFYAMHGCDKNELTQKSKELGKVFHEFYEKRATKIRSRKNAKNVLGWLFENSISSVIISNHTVAGINRQLKRLKIKECISAILANTALDSSMKAMSKRERLENYIKSNNIEKSNIIIVGDTCEEIEIGKNIGINTVAITGGYYSASRLRQSLPDYMINDLGKLTGIIKNMNNH